MIEGHAMAMITVKETTALGRYRLLLKLAGGGMGSVFLARVGGLGGFRRFFAVKQLHPHLVDEPGFVDMFLDEARVAAQIHHPNVASILEIGRDGPHYFLAMDYVEGGTAADLVRAALEAGGELTPGVAVRIVTDALQGLQCAHSLVDDRGAPLGLVHRDISPHNVLVGTDGVARLSDFGIARAAARISKTQTGELKGKIPYMSPEQAEGESLDARSDVFSMGIVLWELLTSTRLFDADTALEALRQVRSRPIPTVRDVNPLVPRDLDNVCMRALARNRDLRYPSALAFLEELETAGTAAGALASSREVATFVQTVMESVLEDRRTKLRYLEVADQEAEQGTLAQVFPEPRVLESANIPPYVFAGRTDVSAFTSTVLDGRGPAPQMLAIAPRAEGTPAPGEQPSRRLISAYAPESPPSTTSSPTLMSPTLMSQGSTSLPPTTATGAPPTTVPMATAAPHAPGGARQAAPVTTPLGVSAETVGTFANATSGAHVVPAEAASPRRSPLVGLGLVAILAVSLVMGSAAFYTWRAERRSASAQPTATAAAAGHSAQQAAASAALATATVGAAAAPSSSSSASSASASVSAASPTPRITVRAGTKPSRPKPGPSVTVEPPLNTEFGAN